MKPDYYKDCNLAQMGIKNSKIGEKILDRMPESIACQSCKVIDECKTIINDKISKSVKNQK